MRNLKRRVGRFLAMLLVIAMVISLVPESTITAFAQENGSEEVLIENESEYESGEGGEEEPSESDSIAEQSEEVDSEMEETESEETSEEEVSEEVSEEEVSEEVSEEDSEIEPEEVIPTEEKEVSESVSSAGTFESDYLSYNYFSAYVGYRFIRTEALADATVYVDLRQYDKAGKLLVDSRIGTIYSHTDDSNYKYVPFDIFSGMAQTVMVATYEEDGEVKAMTEYVLIDKTEVPELSYKLGKLHCSDTKISVEAIAVADFEKLCSSGSIGDDHYWTLQYREKGTEEWKSIKTNKYMSFYSWYDEEDAKYSQIFSGLKKDTTYEGKLIISRDEVTDKDGNVCYPFYQELDLGTFQTCAEPDKGELADFSLAFSDFRAFYTFTYRPSLDAVSYDIYALYYDADDNLLEEAKFDSSYYNTGIKTYNSYLSISSAVKKMAIKVVENCGYDDNGNVISEEVTSDKFERTKIPSLEFEAGEFSVGSQILTVPVTIKGDWACSEKYEYNSIQMKFALVDESDLSTVSSTYNWWYTDDREKTISFSGLTSNKTYNLKLNMMNASGEVLDSIELPTFTTKKNETYNVNELFPDTVFRTRILYNLGYYDSVTEITTAQLERITSFYYTRSTSETEPIKSIEGVDKLTFLTSLSLEGNEIEDVSKIDWKQLQMLNYLDLAWNNLTSIPDLSQTRMQNIYLSGNCIPSTEFANANEKFPADFTITESLINSQRTGEVEIITEDIYFSRAGNLPVFVGIEGHKRVPAATVSFKVDGADMEITYRDDSSYSTTIPELCGNLNTTLAEGTHTLSVEVTDSCGAKCQKEATFTTYYGVTAATDKYYTNAGAKWVGVELYETKQVKQVNLVKDGEIFALGTEPYSYSTGSEPRYKKLKNLYLSSHCNYTSVTLKSITNSGIPVGLYDVEVINSDGSKDIVKGVVEVTEKAFILGGTIGDDYDSTGDYFYLAIRGRGFDVSKLNYAFTINGKEYDATFVNAKTVADGYVVKFKKADKWEPVAGMTVNVKVTPKDGYDIILVSDSFNATVTNGMYFMTYNEMANRIEVGITADQDVKKYSFTLTRYANSGDYYDNISPETVEIEYQRVTESVGYLIPMKGKKEYTLPDGFYYFRASSPTGIKTEMIFEIGTSSKSIDTYWSSSSRTVRGGVDTTYEYAYYSDIELSSLDKEKIRVEMKYQNSNEVVVLSDVSISSRFDYKDYALFTISVPGKDLKAGTYSLTLYNDDREVTYKSFSVRVFKEGRFYITSLPYISRDTEDSVKLCLNTINTAETDEFDVKVYDYKGELVQGTEAEVIYRSDGASVNMRISGIDVDAYSGYYFYITHKEYGEPYSINDELYYSNELGMYLSFGTSSYYFYSVTNEDSLCGIGINSSKLIPATLEIYEAYDTTLVYSKKLTEEDFGNSSYYYFDNSLIKKLPDSEGFYDVVCIGNNGYVSVFDDCNISCRENEAEMYVAPSSVNLVLGDSATESQTVKVYNAKSKPTYTSANTNIATVKASSSDAYSAVITAVGIGSTTVKITAAGKTVSVFVTVTEKMVAVETFAVTPAELELGVGEVGTIFAVVSPANAWNDSCVLNCTTSDEAVAVVTTDAAKGTCTVEAKGVGVATITATLKDSLGNVHTATAKITVKGVWSEEEQDDIVEELGTLYYLEGTDKSLADIVLPSGYMWNNPATAPVADDALPVQYFGATYAKEGYQTVSLRIPVRVVKLEGVVIEGADVVHAGDSEYYEAELDYIGYKPEKGQFAYAWTVGANAELKSDATEEKVLVTFNGGETVKIAVKVTNPTTKKSVDLSAQKDVKVMEIAIKVAETQPEKAVKVTESTSTFIRILADDFDKKNASKLALTIGEGSATWSSSDTGVLTVDKNGVVTIKKAGIAVVSAKVGESTGGIEIRVEDNKPVLESAKATVYAYCETLTPIGINGQNGNEIVEIGTNVANLKAVKNEDGTWCFKATGYTVKKTESVTLSVKTKERAEADTFTMKVSVDVTRPDAKSVKMKQTVKPNIFYSGDEAEDAVFTVSSKYVIEDIYTAEKAGGYQVVSFDEATGKLVLHADGLSRSTVASYNHNPKVYVKAAGYEAVAVTMKVAYVNKKPSLKLDDANLLSGNSAAEVAMYQGKVQIDTTGMIFMNAQPQNVALAAENGNVKVTLNGTKAVSYKVNVRKETWTSDVTVKGKIKLVDAKKLAITTNAKKFVANTNAAYNEEIIIKANVKGNCGLPVVLQAKDTKKALTVVKKSADTFAVSVPAETKKGSYKIQIIGTIGGVSLKSTTVTVSVTNAAPTAKLSAKGSINLANRANSGITYKVALKNLPADLTVTKVTLDAVNNELFGATIENGTVVVRALKGAKLKAKQSYAVNMTFTLSNGKKISTGKAVVIKPVDKLPKIKVKAISQNLYKTNDDKVASYQLQYDAAYTVNRIYVEADKKGVSENFDVVLKEGNVVEVSLKNGGLKSGTYNITCKAIVNEADNSKPVKVKLKVVVK